MNKSKPDNLNSINTTKFYYDQELQVLYKKSEDMVYSMHVTKEELEKLYFFLYTEIVENTEFC